MQKYIIFSVFVVSCFKIDFDYFLCSSSRFFVVRLGVAQAKLRK